MRRKRGRSKEDGYRLEGDALETQLAISSFAGRAEGDYVYQPSASQMIPKDGAWVMIVRSLPPMEFDLHEKMIVGGVFYAERVAETDDEGFSPDGAYKVRVKSPWGDVILWPYEYAVKDVVNLIALWQEGALEFTATSIDRARLNDVVFYCRQRCIGIADAMVMALGSLSGSVGYFLPPESVREDLREMAESIGRSISHPVHQARREAARAWQAAQDGQRQDN